MIIYKYDQLDKQQTYDELIKNLNKYQQNIDGRSLPEWGQLKLLMTEILFLTKYYQHDITNVLYVGAASGYHIPYLSKMFPKISFDLFDPEPFAIKQTDKIKIFNRFFTNEDAEKYAVEFKNKKLAFITDIRTLLVGKAKRERDINKFNEIIDDDLKLQIGWVNIIKPFRTMIKFKLPYDNKMTECFDGKIYLQPFSHLSTETRLIIKDTTKMKKYNNSEYEKKLLYFNAHIRHKKYDMFSAELKKLNFINVWDTNIMLYMLKYYLEKVKKTTNKEDLINLARDIVNYLGGPNPMHKNKLYLKQNNH